MNITGINNGSLTEIMDETLQNLRNTNENRYLSSRVASGRNKLKVVTANKRGFVVALDYSTNASGGYMSPTTSGATGNMATPSSPSLDRLTAGYQYVQFSHQVDNENIANSPSGLHKGPSAKALAVRKVLERRLEFEEWFFCRGDGSAIMGDITAGASFTAATPGNLTLAGTRDGAGAWMLRPGQRIRVFNSTLATSKGYATVNSKASNTVINITTDANMTVVDTDVVLPEGDLTLNATAGIKGLPYIVKDSGTYFDKSLSTVPDLKAIVDSATATFTRTTMEQLYRRHRSIRNNGSTRTEVACSPAQMSNYYAQFYTQNTAQVNVIGGDRPGIDVGGAAMEYTFWGQEIREYKLLHPKYWYNLDPSSFYRLTIKDAGALLLDTGRYQQKISSGTYVNAQVAWDDDYLEYLSPNPAKNSAFTALAFTGLPLLVNDTSTG